VANDWSDEELLASVQAYVGLMRDSRSGGTVNKAAIYRELAETFGRTAKAFEYRMQNISYVLALLGRPWLKGVAPARNVGSNVAARIERMLASADGRTVVPTVAVEVETRKQLQTPMVVRPAGNARPTATVSESTTYNRNPSVRAWVLQRARGVCECCEHPAPFTDATGAPYLEVHHLRQLADAGSDRPSNAVALCPNCHRRLHFGADASILAQRMFDRIPELVREWDV
jgi:5-methylcytosine-specific restriction protein A